MVYNIDEVKRELAELLSEHEDLNDSIDDIELSNSFSEFTLRRLKKRKLVIKDKIEKLKSLIYPDIIA